MTITQFWPGTAAALSCALIASVLACEAGGGKKHVVIKVSGPQDASTAMVDFVDGSVPLERCVVDAKYLAQRKACSEDADCALFVYRASCCPDADSSSVGITEEDLDEVQACAATNKAICSCTGGLTRAEDGRVVSDNGPAHARCVDQKCVSSVGTRACGSRATCTADEICVTYENVEGGIPPDPDSPDNKLLTFRCVPNPCQGQLECECVQPICDARNDSVRKCEIKRNADSDVTCSAIHD